MLASPWLVRTAACAFLPICRRSMVLASASSLNKPSFVFASSLRLCSSTSVKEQDKAAGKKATEVGREIKKVHAVNSNEVEQPHLTPSVKYSENDYNLPHPIWANEYVYRVENTHIPPVTLLDKMALWTINAMRFNFDWMSGWMFGTPTIQKAIRRCVFLETVAGVPGSIGGIIRHLSSLRRMRRDNGWIHTLFEEAENERMHLLTFLTLKDPGPPFRFLVWVTQGIYFNFYFLAYVVSPRFCHRLVGYLEEQATYTYTHLLEMIDQEKGDLGKWKTEPAPEIARTYWKLPPTATMKDVIAVIRADESHHRDVNHAFASMQPNDPNPFKPGY